MPYELRGRFLEACDCSVPCPCWFQQDPDEDECTGLIAWQVEEGTINGFDVSGLAIVSLSQHGGHRDHPEHAEVALVIDPAADDSQFIAMKEAFSGRLGGPLAEMGGIVAAPEVVERAPLSYTTDGITTHLTVGPRVDIETQLLAGANGGAITISNGVLSPLLGDPGEAGRSARFHLELPGRDPIEATARSTTSGRFHYRHEG
jgi:hypothetical protein